MCTTPFPSSLSPPERTFSHRTWSHGPGLQNNSPEKPAQLLAGKAEEVHAFALSFPNICKSVSGEEDLEPFQDGAGEEVEEIMGGSTSMSEGKGAAGIQASTRAEEPETHPEVTDAEGATEAKEPEGSSEVKDTAGRTSSPEVASSILEFLQARQLEPAPPTSTAVLSSELLAHCWLQTLSRSLQDGTEPPF